MDNRLKETEGTQSTFSRTKLKETLTKPTWVTCALSPLGNSTTHLVELVIEVNKLTKQMMWSMAHVSRTQVIQL